MRSLTCALVLLAVVSAGASAQQLETNDAGGSLFIGTTTQPIANCPVYASPTSTVALRVTGAPSAPLILLLGQLAATSIPTDASLAEYFDLSLSGFLFVIADGFSGSGVPFFNFTNANGLTDFAFGMNAGVNVPFAFQAVVLDGAAPFGLNFTAAAAFTNVVPVDTTPPLPPITGNQTLVQADDVGTVKNLVNPITIYGTAYTQVKVDTNGWILFGSGLTAGSNLGNTVATFLAGTPQGPAGPMIAVCWDDLDVGNRFATQGLVIDEVGPGHLVCTWYDPDRFATTRLGGTLVCDVNDNGGSVTTVTMTYGFDTMNPVICTGPFTSQLNATVGVSSGPIPGTDSAVDLATGGVVNGIASVGGVHTIYQDFANGTWDLTGLTLNFLDAAGTIGDFLMF